MYIDTHSHLNFKAFNDDYKDAIKRAFDVGVGKIINVGSNLETSEKAIEIAEEHQNICAAVGLHPIHVNDIADEHGLIERGLARMRKQFLALAQNEKVVAIGETGIDLFHDKLTLDLQREVFVKFLEIAKEVNKPVIIHCREAENELLEILKSQKTLPKGVVHCFVGNWQFAQEILNLGLMISFTGIITFTKDPSRNCEPRQAMNLLDVVKKVPLNKIMIETDCPYLAPQAYRTTLRQAQGSHTRGVRNEPAYVIEVAKKIAEIKNIDLAEVEKQTTKNAIKLFDLK